jgi:hypothetical protein
MYMSEASNVVGPVYSDDLRVGVPYQIVEANLPPQFGEGIFNTRNPRRRIAMKTEKRPTTLDRILSICAWRGGSAR